jgi:hypothetical protein
MTALKKDNAQAQAHRRGRDTFPIFFSSMIFHPFAYMRDIEEIRAEMRMNAGKNGVTVDIYANYCI